MQIAKGRAERRKLCGRCMCERVGMRSWTLEVIEFLFGTWCGWIIFIGSRYELRSMCNAMLWMCGWVTIESRSRIRFIVILIIHEIFEILRYRNAFFEHINRIIRARALLREKPSSLSLFCSFSLFFYFLKTSRHRDLHNCERLFVLVSWPPHTRFGTLGALLWSWFICKWPGTPAHDGAELKTNAYWTTHSFSLPLSLSMYPSFSFARRFTFSVLFLSFSL